VASYVTGLTARPTILVRYMDSPLRCKSVAASGVRIGLRSIYPASDASVDAGPDDIRSQEPHKAVGVKHHSDYQACPAAV
jgi:hypothetical protein